MIGAFAHGAILFIRDHNPKQNDVLARMFNPMAAITFFISNKGAIISHLGWAGLFLGFHTLGFYVHNVMLVFGNSEKQILIKPLYLPKYN